VQRLWHNSFDEVIGNDPKELTQKVTAQFGPASVSGDLPADASVDAEGEDEEVVFSTIQVLASIPQGHRLRLDAEALGIPPNPEFDEKLILATADEVPLKGLTFTVAGPMVLEVKELQKMHDEWLKKLKAKGLTPEEAHAAYVDKSVPNLSSLVMLVQAGDDQTMLLTGDARGDKILEGLEQVGGLKAGLTLHVEVLKVPHHGSSNNLERGFFERITADHYVFSGNGEHGNPERESLKMLLDARGAAPFAIHLTYPIDEIDAGRKKDWEQQQAKERANNAKRRAAGKPELPVRPDWSGPQQSLAAFFQDRPLGAGQTLHVVPEKAPHVIDLLDPLGF